MLFAEIVLNFLHVLTYVLIVVLVGGVFPYGFLLVREEMRNIFTNLREMREDNRASRRRMDQLVRDAEIRWERMMGVKTNG